MEKIYRLLPWLSASDAAHFLHQLTDTPVTVEHLRQFCAAGHCLAYVDCGSVKGEEYETCRPVCSGGIQRLERPEHITRELFEGEGGTRPEELLLAFRPLVLGPAWVYPSDRAAPRHQENVLWSITTGPERYHLIFKPADIEALAAKMNGFTERPAEAENLRQQLELESAGRYVAEGEVLDLRDELGAEREARLSAERRAKKAEAAAAKLRQEMEATYHARKADEEYRAVEAYQNHLATGLTEPSADPVNGLQFPYSTKELEAMCKVASEHWANLTPDKRQPTQLSIQKALCDALGLTMDKNGDPPRKTKALATAIRPHTGPDT